MASRRKYNEDRLKKEAERLKATLARPRAGIKKGVAEIRNSPVKKEGYEYATGLLRDPTLLKTSPLDGWPYMSRQELDDLGASIREKGILTPILIKPDNTILAGKNRTRAAITLGLKEVPVTLLLSEVTPSEELAIINQENSRRREVTFAVRLEVYRRSIEDFDRRVLVENRGRQQSSENVQGVRFGVTVEEAQAITGFSEGRIKKDFAKIRNEERSRQEREEIKQKGERERVRLRMEKVSRQIDKKREEIRLLEEKLRELKAGLPSKSRSS